MKKQIFNFNLLVFILHILFISCTKEIDLNQINDLEINPITTLSLFYFDATASEFITTNSNTLSQTDFVQIDVFNDPFLNDNLIKAELEFETVNSINRAYEVQVDFFNNTNQLQHTLTFLTIASPNNQDIATRHIEVFEADTLENLKQTSALVFTLTMLPGQTVNATTPGNINLKSKATLFLNIKRSI